MTTGRGRAACGQYIIDNQYAIIRCECVDVDFQAGAAILKLVRNAVHVIRQFAGFAQRYEAYA
jgi:hypothetical protein